VTTDDLSAPLGQRPARKRRVRLPLNPLQMLAAALGLFLAVFAGFALFNSNPLGGEPMARIAYDPATLPGDKTPPKAKEAIKDATKDAGKAAAPAAPAEADGKGQKTITIIDGTNGARRDVVVAAPGDAPPAEGTDAAAAPSMGAGINPKLVETTRYGPVPVTAGDLTSFKAYAAGSDAERARAAKMPAIALVVTGLGIGAARTGDAITKLPPAVTLAFTPYGADPAKVAERARAAKHEILLQVPMEPFDYPDNDPGPRTLLSTLPVDQNLDRLMWHMSRFGGYVGLANFMGSRFVASEPAMQLVMKEAGKRGLAYLDDGASARSTARQLAEGSALPFARADLAIDAVPTALEVDRALAKLEGIARERGAAVGTAAALPVSVERIAAWAKTLESRGILLVPLTTVMLKSKS
jgi:polysaccharide deacetylase 2 family uncharacterized protein YibQ